MAVETKPPAGCLKAVNSGSIAVGDSTMVWKKVSSGFGC